MTHWTDTFFTGAWSALQRAPAMRDVAPKEARNVRRALRLRKGSRVADVPCGDGRISFELARAGCEVVGVDRCQTSIRRARRRFREAGLAGEFHVGDMRRLRLDAGFNAVVNWWGSFGYFDDETNLEVLEGFARLLRPGGRVLIDQANRERILREFRERFTTDYGPVRISTVNRWDPEAQRIDGVWIFQRGGRRVRRHSSIRLYTPRQMTRLVERAGLEVERFCDCTDGSDFTRGSRRMTTIARRPRSRGGRPNR